MPLRSFVPVPVPEPEIIENSSHGGAQYSKRQITDGTDDIRSHRFYSEQDQATEPIKCPPISHFAKPPCRRAHRRNTSQSSFTSTSSGTGIGRRTRSIRLKSPYLGPVAWTVPPKNSSQLPKPFLIYQDPPWLVPPDVAVDAWGYIAASDDKENSSHHQRHYSGSDVVDSSSSEVFYVGGPRADIVEQLVEENAVASAESIMHLATRRRASTSPDNRYRPLSSSPLRQQHEELLHNPRHDSQMVGFSTSPERTASDDDYVRSVITATENLNSTLESET